MSAARTKPTMPPLTGRYAFALWSQMRIGYELVGPAQGHYFLHSPTPPVPGELNYYCEEELAATPWLKRSGDSFVLTDAARGARFWHEVPGAKEEHRG